jgi:RNA polymerase sigma-70 factor (ECF subfamily)
MTVSRRIATFNRDKRGAFHGWLHEISNRWITAYWREYCRRQRTVIIEPIKLDGLAAHKESIGPDGSSNVGDPPPPGGELVIILRGLLELIRPDFEDRTFQAFLKVAVDGRPAKDVAEELGMTRNNVDQANFKVRKRLKQEFEALGLPVSKGKMATTARVAGTKSEVTS